MHPILSLYFTKELRTGNLSVVFFITALSPGKYLTHGRSSLNELVSPLPGPQFPLWLLSWAFYFSSLLDTDLPQGIWYEQESSELVC